MKTVGIIAEYNPFHNGHKYQIEKAKEITGATSVVIIMSGSFTQQGNISIVDKFKRAEMAIHCGADLVIELPTIFATSSAEMFAFGAVNILNKLNSIDYLVFGSECDNITVLNNIVDKITNYNGVINKDIQTQLKTGISYASARDYALKNILTPEEYSEFSKPNNILAIEYLKALKKIDSKIMPIAIKRNSANHNDININDNCMFSSATSIRNCLEQTKNADSVNNVIPETTYNILVNSNLYFNEDMYNCLRSKILSLDKKQLESINEVSEGLENKILSAIIKSKSYNELLGNIKSKRYTMSRIKRILINVLLGITKEKYELLNNVYYARILKINKNNNILGFINKNASIPIISNINDNSLNLLDDKTKESFLLDFNSTNIYQVICNNELNIDRTNKI